MHYIKHQDNALQKIADGVIDLLAKAQLKVMDI